MAAATIHILPQDILAMGGPEFIAACKRVLSRTTLPSSSHKGKERPIEEFEHALRKRALRPSGALNPKGGLYPGMPLPKTPDYQTHRNDLVNCVNNPAYAVIRKAMTKGDIDTVEREQKVRGRGLLRRGIAPAPYKYPKIRPPISYYYEDDDPTTCSLSDTEDVEMTHKEEAEAAAVAPSSLRKLLLLRARRAAAQKANEDQEAADAAAREAAAASDAAAIAAERVLAAAEAATSASLLANMKARDAALLAEQAKLSQQSLATLVSNDC